MVKLSFLAILSFLLGIGSLLLTLFSIPLTGFIILGAGYTWIPVTKFLAALIGLILGIISLLQISKKPELTGKWIGIVGIVLCAFNILLPFLLIPIGMLMYFS